MTKVQSKLYLIENFMIYRKSLIFDSLKFQLSDFDVIINDRLSVISPYRKTEYRFQKALFLKNAKHLRKLPAM